MSSTTVQRPVVEAEKPTTRPANAACCREEEFLAALDSYIGNYSAKQANRLFVRGSSNCPHALIRLQPLGRLRKACQVRLFLQRIGGEWGHQRR